MAGKVRVHTLPEIVFSFNSDEIGNDLNQDFQFILAYEFMIRILTESIKRCKAKLDAYSRFDEVANVDGPVIILSEQLPWKEIVLEKYPDVRFLIAPSTHPGNPFSMFAVPINTDSRELKMSIERPDWFKGFIHEGKWIAASDSQEELVALANWNISHQKIL